jgi:hypothetical protein
MDAGDHDADRSQVALNPNIYLHHPEHPNSIEIEISTYNPNLFETHPQQNQPPPTTVFTRDHAVATLAPPLSPRPSAMLATTSGNNMMSQ